MNKIGGKCKNERKRSAKIKVRIWKNEKKGEREKDRSESKRKQ
jgi:hypothetical protein